MLSKGSRQCCCEVKNTNIGMGLFLEMRRTSSHSPIVVLADLQKYNNSRGRGKQNYDMP